MTVIRLRPIMDPGIRFSHMHPASPAIIDGVVVALRRGENDNKFRLRGEFGVGGRKLLGKTPPNMR